MTYDNRANRLHRFFRIAFKDWPFTTWTAIVLLALAALPSFFVPGYGVVIGWIALGLLVVLGIIFVIVKIAIEFADNT